MILRDYQQETVDLVLNNIDKGSLIPSLYG